MAVQRVVLLRHAEKPEDPKDPKDPHLSPAGQARAKMLATMIPERFPNPGVLFATRNSKDSDRPEETLQPTADALHMKLHHHFQDAEYPALAAKLTDPAYDVTLAIVCWHHGELPRLAVALGVPQAEVNKTPPILQSGKDKGKWDPQVFDYFWILDFGAAGVTLTTMQQR
jgi:broad specificity phosphatase PhoE